jgi:hypothetical protein
MASYRCGKILEHGHDFEGFMTHCYVDSQHQFVVTKSQGLKLLQFLFAVLSEFSLRCSINYFSHVACPTKCAKCNRECISIR